jgi:hypothetical protein
MQPSKESNMNAVKAVLAVTGALVVGGGAMAITSSGAASPDGSTIQLTATPQGGSQLDLGRKGVSPGDQFFEHGELRGARNGNYTLSGQLVSGNARRGREHAMLTIYLADGTIVSEGGHGLNGRFAMPVVGGTGAYAGARGTLAVSPGKKETESITITLD